MMNRKLSKFAAVLALSAGLTAFGASASQAGGPPKQLIGGLIGGAAGVGAGLAFGKGQGALIGGLVGAAIGAIVADRVDTGDRRDRHHGGVYDGYVPPPPATYEPAVVYQPAPPPVYGPVGATQYPVYQQPSPYPVYEPVYAGTDMTDCRRFDSNAPHRTAGMACLQPDGSWRVFN